MNGSVTKYDTVHGARWQVRWSLPDGPSGQRRQRAKRGFTTKSEASKYLRHVLGEQDRGRPVERSRETIAQAVDHFLHTARAAGKQATTLDLWTNALRVHVVPRLGGARVGALTGDQVADLYAELSLHGKAVYLGEGKVCRTAGITCTDLGCRPERHEGLGTAMTHHVHTTLRAALLHALAEGATLPTDTRRARAALPKSAPAQVESSDYWTDADAHKFLTATQCHRWGTAYALALATGMRRSELAGLQWGDVELGETPSKVVSIHGGNGRDDPHLWVRRTITAVRGRMVAKDGGKTTAATRRVPLGDFAIDLLRRHHDAEQARAAANGWEWSTRSPVFATDDGEPVNPTTLTRSFTREAGKAGVPPLGIHSARHYAITSMLRRGVPVTTVAKIVGHAKPSVTFDVYSHAIPKDDRLAAAAMDGALTAPSHQTPAAI